MRRSVSLPDRHVVSNDLVEISSKRTERPPHVFQYFILLVFEYFYTISVSVAVAIAVAVSVSNSAAKWQESRHLLAKVLSGYIASWLEIFMNCRTLFARH